MINEYVPILKGKRGELSALSLLSPAVRKTVTPLFDIPRVSLKYVPGAPTGTPKETLDAHLIKSAEKICKLWGDEQPFFIDLTDIDLSHRMSNGQHPLLFIFNLLDRKGRSGIPVTGFDRDDDYDSALQGITGVRERGVCFRILRDDLQDYAATNAAINDRIKKLRVEREACSLILDFRSITEEEVDALADLAEDFISNLSSSMRWRKLTIAGSAFPQSMAGINRQTVSRIPRVELELWRKLRKKHKDLPRVPGFGDYGIVHPDLLEFDPRKATMGGKIRYTVEDAWVILKGNSFKTGEKGAQYHSLSKKLASSGDFLGSGYSWGDEYIAKCAKKSVTPGNLETWVKVDTNHHISFVANQIANEA